MEAIPRKPGERRALRGFADCTPGIVWGQNLFDSEAARVANDPAFEKPFWMGSDNLVKADLGTKRVCPSCGARFYDLQKRPIECPKCAFAFEPEALYKQRRPRQPEPVAAEAVPAETEEETEEEEAEPAESEEATVEPVADEPAIEIPGDDDEEETVAEEPEPEEAGMSVVEGEDADLEDLGDEDVEEDEDEGLLEEVEEDADDVTGIIDTDIDKDER
jgi:uncharacterized protein (TIGR02300 family)